MKKSFSRIMIAGMLLIAFLIFGTACGENENKNADEASMSSENYSEAAEPAQIEKETALAIIEALSGDETTGPGMEWSVIAIARSSLAGEAEAQRIFMKYQDELRLQIKQKKGDLDPERPTDNAKAAIAMKMTGEDPTSVEGFDLIEPLERVEKVREQGINAEIWALIAANICGRDLESEEAYIDDILKMQKDEGGFTFDGETTDVDITAMAIQALVPYIEDKDKVAEAVDGAEMWLGSMQEDRGGYGSAESTAQVIIALNALGKDPMTADGFITEKDMTLFDGLMGYRAGDGFCHSDEETADPMATEQALCALDAINLSRGGQSFYIWENGKEEPL